VEEITPEIFGLAAGSGSDLGTGGMVTKLHAAEICTEVGTDMVITNGKNLAALYTLAEGGSIGTRFLGKKVN
jgi:glutamate 5-kinase